ncbi:MAG: hypothetical protein HRT57_00500 [Crocinitomicaceae bacterium]|nr:hypothetical protein [Crocinitomicaceae bacterium]
MHYLLFAIPFISFNTFSQDFKWEDEKIEVKTGEDQNVILSADAIISEGWNSLAQPNFWRSIMTLAPDSCIVNIAKTRVVIEVTSNTQWNKQTNDQKDAYRDSVQLAYGLTSEDRIFVTTGKKDFYKFDVVYPSLANGVAAFESNDVDPWYAQSILLIESPGQLKKSRAGAYGPFQLMPAVARAQGLTVSRYKDERSDFERSAFGSSNLIKKICIPEAKRILNAHNLKYSESDIWFRLFVLHVYHAGAGNVSAVVNKIAPKEGGQSLIQSMWNTTAASFGNNSQNYSQLALASQLILHDMVHEESNSILYCASAMK